MMVNAAAGAYEIWIGGNNPECYFKKLVLLGCVGKDIKSPYKCGEMVEHLPALSVCSKASNSWGAIDASLFG